MITKSSWTFCLVLKLSCELDKKFRQDEGGICSKFYVIIIFFWLHYIRHQKSALCSVTAGSRGAKASLEMPLHWLHIRVTLYINSPRQII